MIAQFGCSSKGCPRTARHCATSVLPTNQATTSVAATCTANQRLSRRGGDGGLVDVGVASGNRLWGKGGESMHASGGAERGAVVGARQHRHGRRRERARVDGGDEDPGAAVLHD